MTDIITALFRPHRQIGPITAQVTISETSVDDLTITKHPIDQGAEITDHAFKNPEQLTLVCGWSNSGLSSIFSSAAAISSAIENADSGSIKAGTLNYVNDIYKQLLALQSSRIPFDISTGRRNYKNMLISRLSVKTDQETENALFVTIVCEQVIIVQTQAVQIAPVENMADPKKTAATASNGVKQAAVGNPSATGASPPEGSASTAPWGSTVSVITTGGAR